MINIDMEMNDLYNRFTNMLIKRTIKGWLEEEQCKKAIDKLAECKESEGEQIEIKFEKLRKILNGEKIEEEWGVEEGWEKMPWD